MHQIETYVVLLVIIAIVGLIFSNSTFPIALFLVISGMGLSLIPHFPHIILSPQVVLNIFLPILIYEASAFTSWRDMKENYRPIAMLSVGHVIFIAILVALAVHFLIPEFNWAMCFVLGAIISPPDDIAIISIAEKIRMPKNVVTILMGEGMLNDATALIIFRFALAAVLTMQFSIINAISTFIMIVICETLYGILFGSIMGEIRLRISNPNLQMILSFITPLLAYLPAQHLGGSGVLATVVTGLVIGHFYLPRFPPEVRLTGISVWKTLGFILESMLFLLVGLDFNNIVQRISAIPLSQLFFYSAVIVLVVVVGRFIWVFSVVYVPKLFLRSKKKNDLFPSWKRAFVISWAGMRGGISLAAALIVPALPLTTEGVNPRDLLVFLVFCVIIATLLVQGLTLPWFLQHLGLDSQGDKEKYQQHLTELAARLSIAKAVLRWLSHYKEMSNDDIKLCDEIKFRNKEYRALKKRLEDQINQHSDNFAEHNEQVEIQNAIYLSAKIIEVERDHLSKLWHEKKIDHATRNKLLQQLDYRYGNLT